MQKVREPNRKFIESVRRVLREIRVPRHAEQPPSQFLRRLLKEFQDPFTVLAWLIAYDPDERVRQEASVMLFTALQDPSLPQDTAAHARRGGAPMLVKALRDPAVTDDRKCTLHPLVSLCGVEMAPEEVAACFQDFESASEGTLKKAAAQISDSLEAALHELELTGLLSSEEGHCPTEDEFAGAFGLGAQMTQYNPAFAATFLCGVASIAHEHGMDSEHAELALDLAAQTGGERACWYLGEMGRLPAMGTLGELAGNLAANLKAEGRNPCSPNPGQFSHGMVSSIDGMGSRSLMLFFRTSKGTMDAVSLILNDRLGIKDAWFFSGVAAEVEEEMRERTKSDGFTFAPCNMDTARPFIGDGLAIHQERSAPVPGRFLLFRHFFGSDPIRPQRREPNLGAYMLETMVLKPELAEDSTAICQVPTFGGLWCCSPEAYTFLRRFMPKGTKKREHFALSRSVYEKFISEIAIKEKDRLLNRLGANLEVEALAGRAHHPLNRAAGRAWIVLKENVLPFDQIPFVRELCRKGISAILWNLSMGFANQEEANLAQMKMEEDLETMDEEEGKKDR